MKHLIPISCFLKGAHPWAVNNKIIHLHTFGLLLTQPKQHFNNCNFWRKNTLVKLQQFRQSRWRVIYHVICDHAVFTHLCVSSSPPSGSKAAAHVFHLWSNNARAVTHFSNTATCLTRSCTQGTDHPGRQSQCRTFSFSTPPQSRSRLDVVSEALPVGFAFSTNPFAVQNGSLK